MNNNRTLLGIRKGILAVNPAGNDNQTKD
jgi:hypothetical protein